MKRRTLLGAMATPVLATAPLPVQAAAGVEVLGGTRAEVQGLLGRLRGAAAQRRVAVFIEVLGCLLAGAADLHALSALLPPAHTPGNAAQEASPALERQHYGVKRDALRAGQISSISACPAATDWPAAYSKRSTRPSRDACAMSSIFIDHCRARRTSSKRRALTVTESACALPCAARPKTGRRWSNCAVT